jgi:hypothetical protein
MTLPAAARLLPTYAPRQSSEPRSRFQRPTLMPSTCTKKPSSTPPPLSLPSSSGGGGLPAPLGCGVAPAPPAADGPKPTHSGTPPLSLAPSGMAGACR